MHEVQGVEMPRFDGKVAFVTAGATGIGLATARVLTEGGAQVMISALADDEAKLDAAVDALGPSTHRVICDVRKDDEVDAAVEATLERFGHLDLAFNCAGIGTYAAIIDQSAEDFAENFDTTLLGTYRCLRAEANAMAAHGGAIVNVSSIAASVTHPSMAGYCAAKAGINMLTRCAADEFGELGIRVNAIMPGAIRTPMAHMLYDYEVSKQEFFRMMSIERIGEPEDVAKTAVFLLSDEASWVTGQIIAVDGGITIGKGPDLRPLFRAMSQRGN
jgi:NAD(P)-dependent dehydrogenase (short-subunit alcohol dehydrogenase family)